MANKAVKLYRKCKTPDGWKRYPAAMSANGKVRPNAVIAGGIEVVYPTGHYELRSFEGSKTVWKRVDGNATEALSAHKVAVKRAAVKVDAKEVGLKIDSNPKRPSIPDAVKRFVKAAE